MRLLLLGLALLPSLAFAQTTPQDPRNAANAAYATEAAREKAGTCPNATTTYDINMCLAHEVEITRANYKAFTTALRAMLAPTPGDDDIPFDGGPTGPAVTSAAKAAAFDAAESAWQTYATAECRAVDTFWRGGTIVNSMVDYCSLRLTRARLHELNDAYDMPLHH
jgi:uncharacterized protein YecT (DUF1311 family)